ncbi:MAG: GGDEF domain-containing protein [bacterium]|nr:GGDEF domain-containing protein [bacterium]
MEQIGKTKEGGEIENELIFLKQELVEKDEKIKKLEEENEKLKLDSIHDELTGLKSRGYFMEKARDDISAVSSPESEKRKEGFIDVSFLFCDIDYFKEINDTYGHPFGDEILKEVARLLEANIRDSDTVCRWGGEEITISLLGADEKEAVDKAEKLRKAVEEGINQKYGNNPKYSDLKTSLSIGVSSFESGLSFEELINRSDRAMYLAKKEGRNCVKTYSEIKEKENIDAG